MENIELLVEKYTDSLFTNAHTLVLQSPVHDGRGTFSHLGVRMEGLESGRHLNFSATGSRHLTSFRRDPTVYNEVIIGLACGHGWAVIVDHLEFDTAYFTRNHVEVVHSVELFGSDIDSTPIECLRDERLQGNSQHKFSIDCKMPVIRFRLRLAEGGLARFKVFGKLVQVASGSPSTDLLHAPGQDIKTFAVSDSSYGDPVLCFRPRREGSVMAGWETCRHSYRQKFCFTMSRGVRRVNMIQVDTYMHCLNAFQYICILASPVKMDTSALPSWILSNGDIVSDDDLNHHMSVDGHGSESYQLSRPLETSSWHILLPMMKLNRDSLHTFCNFGTLHNSGPLQSFAVIGLPDGGIHRIGIYGEFADI